MGRTEKSHQVFKTSQNTLETQNDYTELIDGSRWPLILGGDILEPQVLVKTYRTIGKRCVRFFSQTFHSDTSFF